MRIFTEQTLKEYIAKKPEVAAALQEWASLVKSADWSCFADIKRSCNSAESLGNQRFVFNIKGGHYRLVVIVNFARKFVYIRFMGTYKEYIDIDCSNI